MPKHTFTRCTRPIQPFPMISIIHRDLLLRKNYLSSLRPLIGPKRTATLVRDVFASVNCGVTPRTLHVGTSQHPAFYACPSIYVSLWQTIQTTKSRVLNRRHVTGRHEFQMEKLTSVQKNLEVTQCKKIYVHIMLKITYYKKTQAT